MGVRKALEGKIVAVTGAAQGMGRAHAVASAEAGADVVLLDRVPLDSADFGESVAQVEVAGGRALALVADVTSQQSLDAAARAAEQRFGRVDAVIANAGVFGVEPICSEDESLWNRAIEVNLTGAWRTLKAFAPGMMERRSGSVVFIASVNGIEPHTGYAAYSTSKFGVIGLMKNAAVELGAYNIRCNAILPGVVETPMAASLRGARTEEEIALARRRGTALADVSVLQPEDIAAAGVYLNSPMARGVTGVALPVDSGHLVLPGVNLSA